MFSKIAGVTAAIAVGASVTGAHAQASPGTIISAGGATPLPSGTYLWVSGSPYGNAIAIDDSGKLRAFGAGTVPNPPPTSTGFVRAAVGQSFGIALRADGTALHWGNDSYEQSHIPAVPLAEVRCGDWFAIGLTKSGQVVQWGRTFVLTPPPSGSDFVAIGTGNWHSLAVRADGSVVAWGYNDTGACNVPVGLRATRVAGGWQHSMAIRADGSITWWGTPNASTPMTNVPATGRFVDIAINLDASTNTGGGIALRDDGVVVTWPTATVPANTIARRIATGFAIADGDCNGDGIADARQVVQGQLPDYNGNNIPDCCERGEACVVGSYPVQWRVEDGGNGHWYDQRIWTGPKAIIDISASYVAQIGAHAVTITSPSENEFVYRAVHSRTSGATHDGYSILGGYQDPGASDYSEPSGGWRWVTGEPMAYMNWGPGLPDNCCSGESVLQYPNASYWNDAETAGVPAGHQYRVIVEWSADCNNDGAVDYGQILTGQLADANGNGVPDTCEFRDCNHDGIADAEQVKRGQLPDYDGNNIPDCCDRGEACVVGSYPVQWRNAEGGNGHWYQSFYVGPDPTHSEALVVATTRGAYLATMNVQPEQAFCVQLLQHSRAAEVVGGAWFGLTQDRYRPDYSEPSGGWGWVDGTLSFTNWAPGEPSNDCFGAAEDFANIRPDGRWNDLNERPDCVGTLPGGAVNSVLLEWSADCNNDGTVDYGQILRGELPDINHNGTPDTCECIGDIYVDNAINGADLGALLAYWGPVTSTAASRACDLNGDGLVNGSDLGILLAYWGTCGN